MLRTIDYKEQMLSCGCLAVKTAGTRPRLRW